MFQLIKVEYLTVFFFLLIHSGSPFDIGCTNYLGNQQRREQRADGTAPVTFRLYTRKNPTEFQELEIGNVESLLLSSFNTSLPTKIYAPGWNNDGQIAFPTRDEYLLRYDLNFFTVYWVDLVNNSAIVESTKTAGEYTGAFVNFLIENGAPLSSFHLIGHSAGAHVAGVAGASVVYGKVPRITGLDPADGDVWSLDDPASIIDITDGEFVDIMHTNGGNFTGNFGPIAFDDVMGHADFYVNGGQIQPGCEIIEILICCSHCRAAYLFDESINSPVGFVSLKCDSYEKYLNGSCDQNEKQLMGDPVSLTARGKYFVDTNSRPPYALG